MKASVQHTFIGANRVPGAAAVCDLNGTVAFAADRYVALWRPQDNSNGVRALLKGHADAVSVVRSVKPGLIASGSTDGEVRIWSRSDASQEFEYTCISTLSFHKRSINTIAATPDAKFLLVGSGDATISIWSVADVAANDARPLQTIELGPGYYPLALAVESIPNTDGRISYIMAVGATNPKIQVYASHGLVPTFVKAATLKGHEDWVHALAFKHFREDGLQVLYLASGSQDLYIRLWRILRLKDYQKSNESNVLSMLDPMLSNTLYKFHLTPKLSKEVVVDLTGESYVSSSVSRSSVGSVHHESNESEHVIVFHALLMGHDDWIFSLAWHPSPSDRRLLSASADSSLMIWRPDDDSGVWVSETRLGDFSIKGASSATGSAGGLWVAIWDQKPSPEWIATIGKSGGWKVWLAEKETRRWTPTTAITGHAREVTGISWAPGGDYLLTTSADQTTRLLAEWRPLGTSDRKGWHEFARPQIHGYDMVAVTSLSQTEFVSAGDEKILRVLDMPKSVATLLRSLCGIDFTNQANGTYALADSANVPSLGLSNKAVTAPSDDDREGRVDEGLSSYETIASLSAPPLESHLQRHTLFPETEKLYGHGYEISAAAVSRKGDLLATTCRANNAVHSVIRLFDTKTWHEIRPPLAEAHTLTVTSLEFSHDDKYIVSVGRDRMLAVWEVNDEASRASGYYRLHHKEPRGHSRIIWDVSWAPKGLLADTELDYVFATASRDKTVKIWAKLGSKWSCVATERFASPATAVDFRNDLQDGTALLLVGLDDGGVLVYRLATEASTFSLKLLVALDDNITPKLSISQVSWRPQTTESFDFAVASEDCSVRIYSAI